MDNKYLQGYEDLTMPIKEENSMKNYLVRDATNWHAIYGIVRLGSEKYWNEALNYVRECRENGREDADSELVEEYFQMNDIEYEWINFDGELTL